MIIVNLTGGLGNQMFQYAFGKTIAHRYKTELKYHFTNALFNTQRAFELDVFKISAFKATSKDLKNFGIVENRVLNRILYLIDERFKIQLNKQIVTQKIPYGFDSNYLLTKNNSYLQGYWADEKYFKEIEDLIRKEFIPNNKLDEINSKLIMSIQKTNSVSIHVRRGDYVTNKTGNLRFIGLDYYTTAIKKIEKQVLRPTYYVFSDDLEWCKQNFKSLKNVHFINHNKGREAYKDMWLMSNCKHNIIANSTFSWWGSWLNKNKNKICIRPD